MSSRQAQHWSNWSGSVKCAPLAVVKPRSIEELAQMIGQYGHDGRRVRVAGSGHSFTPLVQTGDVLMSLEHLQGIEAIDATRGTATVWGGTRLKNLGDALFEHGLA
ncbi:MAG TPA: FAD-binding protein, partial [Ktedonobacteraceae bacterium]|nr:FAD-binding protein [Ktedonobacteraceae bacterium]